MLKTLNGIIPKNIKDTLFIRYFGLTKVPMLLFVSPRVIALNESECIVEIPLNRRTRNHLNSMYFGVLACGADLAAGLVPMKEIIESKKKISLSFKDFHADFLKRAHDDVHFVCKDVPALKNFVAEVANSGERKNYEIHIDAIVPKENNEVVAKFILTLSLKLKN